MNERRITAKYLADLSGLNPELVRKYSRQLRQMLAGEVAPYGEKREP